MRPVYIAIGFYKQLLLDSIADMVNVGWYGASVLVTCAGSPLACG
jgi:hypothetical protein